MRAGTALQDLLADRASSGTLVVICQLGFLVRVTDRGRYEVTVRCLAPGKFTVVQADTRERELARKAKRRALAARSDKRRRASRKLALASARSLSA